jgi:hypothetical protein
MEPRLLSTRVGRCSERAQIADCRHGSLARHRTGYSWERQLVRVVGFLIGFAIMLASTRAHAENAEKCIGVWSSDQTPTTIFGTNSIESNQNNSGKLVFAVVMTEDSYFLRHDADIKTISEKSGKTCTLKF